MINKYYIISLFAAAISTPLIAGKAEVVDAQATTTNGTWTFDVTVRHDDTGWDHYADGWYVLTEDGAELGYRKLHHPHVTEQPFTRSLSGVQIPDNINIVFIRAHDSVHGDGDLYKLELPK